MRTERRRVLLLNLPYRTKIMRRYVASYFAPNFLIQPLELMSLGSVARRAGWDARIVDAVAENRSLEYVLDLVREWQPDLLVSLLGFNTLNSDISGLKSIREMMGEDVRLGIVGYLPSTYPQETLMGAGADIVFRGEPEPSFEEYLRKFPETAGIEGVAVREGDQVAVQGTARRVNDLDSLPFPDYGLINLEFYNESYLPRPMGAVLTSRGCPYGCSFCVQYYGNRLVERSVENVLEEVRDLVRKYGVKHIRFMDDTFTLNRRRTEEILRGLVREEIDLTWSCLTRLDHLDSNLVELMKTSGCRRIYAGFESGVQRIVDFYNKKLDLDRAREAAGFVKRAGIELSGFFIVGAPEETDRDVEDSLRLAIDLDLDYVIVTQLQYWPGREIFRRYQDELNVSIEPTAQRPVTGICSRNIARRQKRFYRGFYLRPSYVVRHLLKIPRAPGDYLSGFAKFITYCFRTGSGEDFI